MRGCWAVEASSTGIIGELKRIDPSLLIATPGELGRLVGSPSEVLAVFNTTSRYVERITGSPAEPVGGFPVTMRSEYGMRRGWNVWMSIREFVQNALDASEETFRWGRSGEDVWVFDGGPGIKPSDALLIGSSGKQCWQRGFFGEGMKIAMLTLEYMAKPVVVITRLSGLPPLVYRMKPLSNGVVVFLIEKLSNEDWRPPMAVGDTWTMVYALNAYEDLLRDLRGFGIETPSLAVFRPELLRRIGYGLIGFKSRGGSCDYEAIEYLVVPPREGLRGVLWVRDIFVNRIDHIMGRKSVFDYNMWWLDLEANRVDLKPRGRRKFEEKVHQIMAYLAREKPELLDPLGEMVDFKKSLVGGRLTLYIAATKRLEDVLEWDVSGTYSRAVIIKRGADIRGIDPMYVDEKLPMESIVEGMHILGGGTLLMPEESSITWRAMTEAFGKPRFLDAVIRTAKKEHLERTRSEREITPEERALAKSLETLADYISRYYLFIDPPKAVIAVHGRSCYDMSARTLCINTRDYAKCAMSRRGCDKADIMNIIRVFAHELAHHAALMRAIREGKSEAEAMELAKDLTEHHVAMIERMAAILPYFAEAIRGLILYSKSVMRIDLYVSNVGVQTLIVPIPLLNRMPLDRISSYESIRYMFEFKDKNREAYLLLAILAYMKELITSNMEIYSAKILVEEMREAYRAGVEVMEGKRETTLIDEFGSTITKYFETHAIIDAKTEPVDMTWYYFNYLKRAPAYSIILALMDRYGVAAVLKRIPYEDITYHTASLLKELCVDSLEVLRGVTSSPEEVLRRLLGDTVYRGLGCK